MRSMSSRLSSTAENRAAVLSKSVILFLRLRPRAGTAAAGADVAAGVGAAASVAAVVPAADSVWAGGIVAESDYVTL